MLASHKNTRDNSGHSGQPNKYRGSKRPELVSRVFPTRDQKRAPTGQVPRDSALDCALPTTRPMSRTEKAAE